MIKRVLFWDWKEQPNIKELDHAVSELALWGAAHITEVPNPGMDVVAIIVTHRSLSPSEADEMFRIWLEESNDAAVLPTEERDQG